MTLSGTSQAAAVVSGVAAQMLQANPKLAEPDQGDFEYVGGLPGGVLR
jgi:subtilisin family serine protease